MKWNRLCVRLVRITAWPLLAVMVLYLTTGYVLCGKMHGAWLSNKTAFQLHRDMDLVLVGLLTAHTLPAVWLAFVRWGWIRRKDSKKHQEQPAESHAERP